MRGRWACLVFLTASGIFAPARPAPALATKHLLPLKAAVLARTGSSARETRALSRAEALLLRPDGPLSGDLVVGVAAGGVLGKAFPNDPEFEALLAEAAVGLRAEVEKRRDSLAALVQALAEMGRGASQARSLESADAALADAEEAVGTGSLLRLLLRGQRAVERAARSAGLGTDREWLIADVDGRLYTSSLSVGGGFASDGFSLISWHGRSWLATVLGDFSQITLETTATGVGTFTLGVESWGELFSSTRGCSGRYGCGGYSTEFGGSGTLEITRAEDHGIIEGTFSFTVPGERPWPTVVVTHGRFRLNLDDNQ